MVYIGHIGEKQKLDTVKTRYNTLLFYDESTWFFDVLDKKHRYTGLGLRSSEIPIVMFS